MRNRKTSFFLTYRFVRTKDKNFKKIFFTRNRKTKHFLTYRFRTREMFGNGGADVKQKTINLAAELQAEDEEDLVNKLIAISVIAKRLAKKMTTTKTEDKEDVQRQALRTDRTNCQSKT